MNAATSQKRQSGAVTLMGALFIIVTLALMILAVNRMAASNITDTAIQNDAVEALFIAETGIEYASYLYANGTSSCDNLRTAIGSTTSGRGSFDVTASALSGTDCSITVQASVSSVGATSPNISLRTIDAVLRLSSGEIWAVGENGIILQWDGSAWAASTSGVTQNLNGIHCASANNCWAVGNAGTIRYWNGSNWSGQASGTTNTLYSISCEPSNPNNCFASGGDTIFVISRGIIQSWNGASWSNSFDTGVQFFAGDWRFLDLACPSGICYTSVANGVIARYNGAWLNDNSGTSISMNGIDCWNDDDCWAVGDISSNNWNVNERNGAGWNPQTVPVGNSANQNLNTVSCIDASDCWAAGNHDGARYVFGHWDGTNWTVQNNGNNGAQREDINSIHCVAADNCWAVGNARNGWNILRYDGANWNYVGATVANPVDLQDVFIVGGGGGGGSAVSLVRWQEQIINN